MVARLVSDGRGDASSFRVLRRPFAADECAPLVRVMVIGPVVAALLAVVLVLSWH